MTTGISGQDETFITDNNRYKKLLTGCLLAGGQSRRMGGNDKALLELHGKKLLHRAAERLQPQVGKLVLSANAPTEEHDALQFPILKDYIEGHLGPLAGVLSAMKWSKANNPDAIWVLTAATDTPFFPEDLADRLVSAASSVEPLIALAVSGGQVHRAFGVWPVHLAEKLEAYLNSGKRSIYGFVEQQTCAEVHFSGPKVDDIELDPFFNINNPEDIAVAEVVAQELD